MERSKIRETDNTRTFFLARFFIEYLLLLRQKDPESTDTTPTDRSRAGGLQLALVAEMAELESVRFLFGRMRLTMDGRVSSQREVGTQPIIS